ncbi:MAG: sodium:calcium antiporter [Candidatus Moranbacteria bacterium]|jgi:cation:H+ antiporter|nr:sodium:calcium antiporter [Candidatus Moranbacteria bacterium]NCA93597.1 sodium:calcium antiporter [Sphingobacteriia bacterium]
MFAFFGLIVALYIVIRSSEYAIQYSTKIATNLKIPKYIVGFLIVAIISALPETLIGIDSALQGTPSFGLGTILGANVADLTVVFAISIFVGLRSLTVKSKILKHAKLYVFMIALPVIFGFNGYYSRWEGIVLILAGFYFYYSLFWRNRKSIFKSEGYFSWKYFSFLLLSMMALLVGANATVKFGVSLAESLNINPIIIGMFFVGLGTTLPELLFSIKAVKRKHDELAIGDILGMVITDSTIVIGILALITPFTFNPKIIYITGGFMVASAIILLYFMKTGRSLNKKEAIALTFFYLLFVFTELFVHRYF